MIEVSDAFVARLKLSNSAGDVTNDILFTDGLLGRYSYTKRLDATFTAGDGGGGLDTGAIANAWYHCFAIRNATTGAIDYLFSTSISAPTVPGGFESPRRVGSINRNGGAIRLFTQYGEEFRWTTDIQDVSVGTLGGTRTAFTLTVPTGLSVTAIISSLEWADATANIRGVLSAIGDTDQAATTAPNVRNPTAGVSMYSGLIQIRTDTSAQIGARSADTNTTLGVFTRGWIESPGRRP